MSLLKSVISRKQKRYFPSAYFLKRNTYFKRLYKKRYLKQHLRGYLNRLKIGLKHIKIKIRYYNFNLTRLLADYLLTALVFIGVLLFIDFFPSPYIFQRDELPFFGNFQWKSLTVAKLSAGDFRENGVGGLELRPRKLRLFEYRVAKGDTLWGIARKFGVDPDSIISCNTFTNVHKLRIGDTILIPNIRGIFVSVRKDETVYRLSMKYGISPDVIMEVNGLETPLLAPGMRVFLPGVKFNIMERAFALGEAFDKPARGRLTSRFGYRRDPFTKRISFHTGIDIANRIGTAIHAARDGVVSFIGPKYGYGLVIVIKHRFGYRTLYGHLLSSRVRVGQKVKKGQIIGFMGNSGRSTGPHLHFEIWLNSRLIDPLTQTNMVVR